MMIKGINITYTVLGLLGFVGAVFFFNTTLANAACDTGFQCMEVYDIPTGWDCSAAKAEDCSGYSEPYCCKAPDGGGNSGGGGDNSSGGGTNPGPGTGSGSGTIVNPLKFDSISEFLTAVIGVILVFAYPIIVLFIMYAGFMYVTANGDTGKLEKARSALLWAVIGGVIVLGAEIIMKVVEGTVQSFES